MLAVIMASKLAVAMLPFVFGVGCLTGCERPAPPAPASREVPATPAPPPSPPLPPAGRAPVAPGETAPPAPAPGAPAELAPAVRLLSAINESRRRAHLNPLRFDDALVRAADARASDMAKSGYFAHVSPNGRTPFDVIAASGYDYASAGENLARGMTDPARVEDAWMGSRPHRRNVLNPEYRDVGIAIEGDLVVALFGTRRSPAGAGSARGRQ